MTISPCYSCLWLPSSLIQLWIGVVFFFYLSFCQEGNTWLFDRKQLKKMSNSNSPFCDFHCPISPCHCQRKNVCRDPCNYLPCKGEGIFLLNDPFSSLTRRVPEINSCPHKIIKTLNSADSGSSVVSGERRKKKNCEVKLFLSLARYFSFFPIYQLNRPS